MQWINYCVFDKLTSEDGYTASCVVNSTLFKAKSFTGDYFANTK